MSRTYRDRGFYNSEKYSRKLNFDINFPSWWYSADNYKFKKDSKLYKKLMNKAYRVKWRSRYINKDFDEIIYPNYKTCINIDWFDT